MPALRPTSPPGAPVLPMNHPVDTPSVSQHVLPCGLRLVHEPSASPVAYCGFAVDAGTRDEAEDEHGLAHFVEHLLFKGTRRRRAWHILNRMENVGGELNAYTGKEETVVYCAFPAEHFARAFELLADIVFHSIFPAREVTKETEVIVDEIQSYEDSPAELIFDDFEDMAFSGHPLGRNILGTPERLRAFGPEDAARFAARYYVPANMVFFVRGAVDFRRVVRQAERLVADLPAAPAVHARLAPPPYVAAARTLHRDTHQAHVMLGARAYPARHPRQLALALLTNLLGGPGMNSRLNVALRERRGLVYSVEANLTGYTDTGLFGIYFGCDPQDVDTCLRLARAELRRLRDVRLSTSQLLAAQKQLKGQLVVASDNGENQALSLGKAWLHYGHQDTLPQLFGRIDALTPALLLDVAAETLAEDRLSTLAYL